MHVVQLLAVTSQWHGESVTSGTAERGQQAVTSLGCATYLVCVTLGACSTLHSALKPVDMTELVVSLWLRGEAAVSVSR